MRLTWSKRTIRLLKKDFISARQQRLHRTDPTHWNQSWHPYQINIINNPAVIMCACPVNKHHVEGWRVKLCKCSASTTVLNKKERHCERRRNNVQGATRPSRRSFSPSNRQEVTRQCLSCTVDWMHSPEMNAVKIYIYFFFPDEKCQQNGTG